MKLKKERLMELAGLLSEAMLGGVSNGGPAPGHRAKANEVPGAPEEESCESINEDGLDDAGIDPKQPHKLDIWNARDELAAMAYDLGGQIQGMHLDDSDHRTKKMTQKRLIHVYETMMKLQKLLN